MSISVDNYLDKIISLITQKISNNNNTPILFPCKYMLFHQAKSYCKNCDDFICDKCIQKHDKSHTILSLKDGIDILTSNINLYKNLSIGKFPKEEKQKKEENIEKIIIDETIEKSFIEEIDNLINKLINTKKKILKFFESRKNLLKEYNLEENNTEYESDLMQKIITQEKFEIKPVNIKEIKEIHDLIKFEQNYTSVFKTVFGFNNDLENKNKEIINNNKYLSKLKKKDYMSIYERINLKTNELNLIMTDSFNHKIKNVLNNIIPYIEEKIDKTEEIFHNVICAYLKINEEEYLKEMAKTEIEDEIKRVEEKIVEKIVEIKIPIKKIKFEENELKMQFNDKLNIINISKNKTIENNIEKDLKDDNKEENEIKEEQTEDNKEEKKEINEEEKEEENGDKSQINQKESDEISFPELNDNNQKNNNPNKKPFLARATAINKKTQIDSYSSSFLSNKNIQEIYSGTYNESKAIILLRDNKYLLDTDEEIEETRKSCYNKLNIFNSQKAKPDFKLNEELTKFTWKERNMFELIYPIENKKLINIYNPYINKVEEIEIETNNKFPINYSIYIRLPYVFISGGKILNEYDEYEITNNFYTLRREGPKIFEKLILPDMLEVKANHCLFEIPYINSLCALGGKNNKKVEIFNLEEKIWKSYPDLNYPRESPSCCVINETYIYCFFGYDEENATYLTTIEKFDLVYKPEWEILNPFGNKTFMKKKLCGCVKYRKNFEENIIIVGGINVLNNESKDCLNYDEKKNNIEKIGEMSLPYKSCFNSSSFIQLPNGIFYNLNMNSQLIQYESSGKYFFGIRDKE